MKHALPISVPSDERAERLRHAERKLVLLRMLRNGAEMFGDMEVLRTLHAAVRKQARAVDAWRDAQVNP